MPLSNEEDRRFEDIIQRLSEINVDSSESYKNVNIVKPRTVVFSVLLFIAGIAALITGVFVGSGFVSIAGFIMLMVAATKMSMLIFSRYDEFKK